MKANFYIFTTLYTLSDMLLGQDHSFNLLNTKFLFIVDAKKNLLFEIFLELFR